MICFLHTSGCTLSALPPLNPIQIRFCIIHDYVKEVIKRGFLKKKIMFVQEFADILWSDNMIVKTSRSL